MKGQLVGAVLSGEYLGSRKAIAYAMKYQWSIHLKLDSLHYLLGGALYPNFLY